MRRDPATLEGALAQLEAAQLRRTRLTLAPLGHDGRRIVVPGAGELTDFASNDYLGLARHPALARALAECAAAGGTGSGAAHLVSGHGPEHAALEEELAAAAAARLARGYPRHTSLLATDGVFSMDGDLAPLPELAQAARAARAWLAVDDAHGLGVVGSSGGGTLEHFGLDAEAVPVLIGTLGKAFG